MFSREEHKEIKHFADHPVSFTTQCDSIAEWRK